MTAGFANNIPVLYCECMFNGVESDDLLEELEHAITRSSVREVSEGCVSTGSGQFEVRTTLGFTHGQDKIETTDIPMMMAAFTR